MRDLPGSDRGSGPLAGLRVAVTRPQPGARELAELLAEAGAAPLVLPLLRVTPCSDLAELRRALASEYDWVAFTSASAVRVVADLVADGFALRARRLAAVGAATATWIRDLMSREPDVVPDEYTGSAVAAAMMAAAGTLSGRTVLWPRAVAPRPEFRAAMHDAGALLTDVPVYETLPEPANAQALTRVLESGSVDVLTLTSPSAVAALAEAGGISAAARHGTLLVAAIGATTAAAAVHHGLHAHVVPKESDSAGLVNALIAHVTNTAGRRSR